MKNFYFLIIFLIAAACNSDDSQNNRTTLTSTCCQNDPVVGQFGDAKVYIPNVFTPNQDGINDLFIIFTNEFVANIIDLDIRTSQGVRVSDNLIISPYANLIAWDGRVDGEVKRGIYIYSVTLESTTGEIREFTGRVCNFPCSLGDGKESFFDSFDNCHTPSQHDLNGGLDDSRPTGEVWPCLE